MVNTALLIIIPRNRHETHQTPTPAWCWAQSHTRHISIAFRMLHPPQLLCVIYTISFILPPGPQRHIWTERLLSASLADLSLVEATGDIISGEKSIVHENRFQTTSQVGYSISFLSLIISMWTSYPILPADAHQVPGRREIIPAGATRQTGPGTTISQESHLSSKFRGKRVRLKLPPHSSSSLLSCVNSSQKLPCRLLWS